MTFTREQLESMAKSVPFWFHSIDLGHGVISDGIKSPAQLAQEIENLALPDLRGKSVLDINAWDGFFSFEAARRSAARVVALDHYMWAMDLAQHSSYWLECKEKEVVPCPYHEMPYYQPDKMPGKAGFDTAARALPFKVEGVVGEFMEMDLATLGSFDVVLYLGSLYHMDNPLHALRRVAKVTKELAIIESEATVFPGFEAHALCEFFESNELNGDVSNWWAPNEKALVGMCRAAGFRSASAAVKSPIYDKSKLNEPEVIRYRAVVHARK